ncbi:alpha/beta hydrolase [bacterium]|nr:alpha/beta hydrolase [bacterium]MCI0603234.1 alpha/beta hydrolase [bacterium]
MVRFLLGVLGGLCFLAQPIVVFGETPQPNTSPSSWKKVDCPFDTKKALLPVTCGQLKVPENYDDPKGRSIEVAFMVISPERKIDPQNAVIFLSGGPGSPSLVHVETLVTVPAIREIVVDRDWVFFDQRGGGRSTPALRCPEEEDWFKRVKTCRDQFVKQGVDLSQYNSARISRDMEALRKALGVKQWNVWGASYGARLAFTVARYYPSSVRSVLVDGPYLPEDQEVVEDLHGAEVVLNKIFWKCTADADCASKYPQLRSRFLAALPKLRQQPLEVGKERFDDWRVTSFLQNSLYGGAVPTFEQRVQTVLAYADAAARGDGKLMVQIEEQMTKDTPAPPTLPDQGKWTTGQNLSIDCHEEKVFETVEEYEQAAAKSDIVRALFGQDGMHERFKACALWPAGQADPIENTRIYYDGPILAFTGELDPTLSGLAGYKIEMIYANARHVVFSNAGHVQFYIRTYNYSPEEYPYRRCALELGRQFLTDPQRSLDTSCATTRQLRLVK